MNLKCSSLNIRGFNKAIENRNYFGGSTLTNVANGNQLVERKEIEKMSPETLRIFSMVISLN